MNRPAPAPVTGRALARGGAMLGVAMMVANAGNYALNVGLARWLSAADFGEATLLVTLFLTTTAVGLTLQMVTAREVARLDAGPDPHSADGLQRWLARRGATIGIALASSLAIASPWLAGLFHMAHPLPLVVFAAGLPAYLALAVHRGGLQGRLGFGPLAASFVVEAAARIALSVALVRIGWGVSGTAVGLTGSVVVAWWLARPRGATPNHRRSTVPLDHLAAVRRAAAPTVALLVGQIMVNNGDVLVAKAAFTPAVAGVYAAVALLGRAVFFATSSVVTTLFPAVARGDTTDRGHGRMLLVAVGVVGGVSGSLTTAAWLAGGRGLAATLGPQYSSLGGLLGPYALATSLFAVASLLAADDLARGGTAGPRLLLAAAAAQTTLLVLVHGSPGRVVAVQIGVMAVLCAVMGRRAVAAARAARPHRPPPVVQHVAMSDVALS